MFGPYEIELEGRRFFGNVRPRESHVFAYGGNLYVFDVKGLDARRISPGLAALVDRLALDAGALVPESTMRALRDLGLVAEEEDAPAEKTAEAKSETAAEAKPEFPVLNIGLFLAQTCNMRCVYCYGEAGEYGGGGLMDKETAFRAVDWLMENSGSLKKVSVNFFGGEPLLNFPLMREITPYARKKAAEAGKEISFGLTTNASILTEAIIAFLKEENIRPMISFDGPPEIQNRQRPFKNGEGSHDTVAANARKLMEVMPNIPARATVYGDADPLAIRRGMEEAGFSACFLAPASPVLSRGAASDEIDEGIRERRLQGMRVLYRQDAERMIATVRERGLDAENPPMSMDLLLALFEKEKRHHGCGVGKGMVAVTVNGDVYPCHRFAGLTEMRLGAIADYKAGAVNAYHRAVVDTLPECAPCWARYLCGGGCFYHNMAVTGDMRRPSSADCRERKAMIESVVHVYCQLDEADRKYVRETMKNASPAMRLP